MSLSFRRMLCSSNARRGPNLTILTMMKIKKLLMMGQTLMKMTKKRKLGITKVRHKKKKEDRDNTEENMKQLQGAGQQERRGENISISQAWPPSSPGYI